MENKKDLLPLFFLVEGHKKKNDFVNTQPRVLKNNSLDDYNTYKRILQVNVGHDNYLAHEITLVDCMIEIMLDVILSESPKIKIAGELKPQAIVKNIFLRLNAKQFAYAIDKYTNVTVLVKNKNAYIRTILYNAFTECVAEDVNIDTVVRNEVF